MEAQICGRLNNKERRRQGLNEIPLPDEVVLSSILSHLTMKEFARISLVSRGWLRYWRHIPVLDFDNPIATARMMSGEAFENFETYCKVLREERRSFVNWVDGILVKHMGNILHGFKVTFFLQNKYRKSIDKWVVWAFSKHVQSLQLDFSEPRSTYATVKNQYVLDKPLLDYCYNAMNVKPVLTSLCLKSVNVSDEFVDQLFESCGSILENLSIEKSEKLTRIRRDNDIACAGLRYLRISDCSSMKTIDINSPKLVTFVYESGLRPGLEFLRIANASCLCHVTIQVENEDGFFNVLCSLAKYFSQLEYLKLEWLLNSESNTDPVVDYFPTLEKLKHLDMRVYGNLDRNIAGWIPFIKACPVLEKLTMELCRWLLPLRSKNMKCDKHPLLYLKTFEIIDFNGENVDVDVAKFVFENGVALEEVIFQGSRAINKDRTLTYFNLKIPQIIKLRSTQDKLKALKEVAFATVKC